MSKRRNCRRTPEEVMAHDKAIRIRKMTDAQMMDYLEDLYKKAYDAGYALGGSEAKPQEPSGEQENGVESFLWYLQVNKVPGIGAVTVNKLLKVASENGYV